MSDSHRFFSLWLALLLVVGMVCDVAAEGGPGSAGAAAPAAAVVAPASAGVSAPPAGAPASVAGAALTQPGTNPSATAAGAAVPADTAVATVAESELYSGDGRVSYVSAGVQPRFGADYFAPARRRLMTMEQKLARGEAPLPMHDSLAGMSGFVGPLDMLGPGGGAVIGERYFVGPGDRLSLTLWGGMVDVQRIELPVDGEGYVTLPKAGKLVARGMNLEQLQKSIQTALRQVMVKDLEVVLTLDKLRSMQVLVVGEAYRPGSYAVSSSSTLFNVLHACGGPSDRGSLRDIRLLRGQKTIRVDFYDFLLQGDSQNDLPLQPGDTIFIARAARQASIGGEVYQPATYELKSGENLRSLIALARGVTPKGVLHHIKHLTVTENREKAVRDVDLSTSDKSDAVVSDGDRVTIQAVMPHALNYVTLAGMVERPGVYELKTGMTLADLFGATNRLLGEAYLERVDIQRKNDDMRTTRLITVHLGKALAKDPQHNLPLVELDQIQVYSRWDVAFIPERKVAIAGAVQKPGTFERGDNMTVRDLLVRGGGLLPNAYLERADLLRYDYATELTTRVPVDLARVMAGDQPANLLLADRDQLRIYTSREARFEENHIVSIYGAVQRPDRYPRSQGLRLRDLIFTAGGVVPGADEEITIARARHHGAIDLITVEVKGMLAGNERDNPLLEDEDVVVLRKSTEYLERPHYVTIQGEVAYSGSFALKGREERLSAVLARSGGLTTLGYAKGAVLKRRDSHFVVNEQAADIERVNRLFNLVNPLEYERQVARNRYLMLREQGQQDEAPSIAGNSGTIVSSGDPAKAAAIGMAPGVAAAVGKTIEMGLASGDATSAIVSAARKLDSEELQPAARIIFDLQAAIDHPGSDSDPLLRDGDMLLIPRRTDNVTVIGAVLRPTTVQVGDSIAADDLLKRAGGVTIDGDEEKVMVVRANGAIEAVVTPGRFWGKKYADIDAGDIVYVPPKVVTLQIEERIDKVLSTVRYAVSTAASVAAFIVLIGLF